MAKQRGNKTKTQSPQRKIEEENRVVTIFFFKNNINNIMLLVNHIDHVCGEISLRILTAKVFVKKYKKSMKLFIVSLENIVIYLIQSTAIAIIIIAKIKIIT